MNGLGVVIFAGGRGVRLRSVTGDKPKALAPLHDATLLDYQLRRVRPLSPDCVVVLAGHNAGPIVTAVGERAQVEVEDSLLGTAGGLCRLPAGPARWLSLNVDHVSDVDLAAFAAAARPPVHRVLVGGNGLNRRRSRTTRRRPAGGMARASSAARPGHHRAVCL